MSHSPRDFFVHETAVVDPGCEIGVGSKVWHFCHLTTGCVLGEGCNLGQNVYVAGGVRLGRNVKVQNNVSLYDGLTCGDDVFVGPSAVFTNVRNPRSGVNRRGAYQSTHLEQGVTIGANATVVCGVRLGAWAFVGAGAVVTHDVAAHALVVGVPARRVGWMSRAGHRLRFDDAGSATCPETNETYRLADGVVTLMKC